MTLLGRAAVEWSGRIWIRDILAAGVWEALLLFQGQKPSSSADPVDDKAIPPSVRPFSSGHHLPGPDTLSDIGMFL